MANTTSTEYWIRQRHADVVMDAQANAFRQWVKDGSVHRDDRYTPNPPTLRVRPTQKIYKVHVAGENWTRTCRVMARTMQDAEAVVAKNGKVVKVEQLCEVPPISRILQSKWRGFFPKIFGKRHDQDDCRSDGDLMSGEFKRIIADSRPTRSQIIAALRLFTMRHDALEDNRTFLGKFGLPAGWHLREGPNRRLELAAGFNGDGPFAIVGRIVPNTGRKFAFIDDLTLAVKDLAAPEEVSKEVVPF